MMKRQPVVVALITGLVLTAGAEARPDARSMTCQQIQALIADQRVVVMDTGPQTYKRFVHHQGFCAVSEVARKIWVEAGDGQCQVRECRVRRHNNN